MKDDRSITDDDMLALDADYDELLKHIPRSQAPLIEYLRHMRKAHESGLNALAEAGRGDKVRDLAVGSVLAALYAHVIFDTGLRPEHPPSTDYVRDQIDHFHEAFIERIRSIHARD